MDRAQTSASDLAELVHSGIWPALLEVRDRTPWSIELVDGSLTPLLGGGHGPARSRTGYFSADLTAPSLRATALECMRTLKPTFLGLGQTTVFFSPVRGGRRAAGAVLVSTATTNLDPLNDRARMSRLGAWIAASLETQLAKPSTGDTSEIVRLASLLKILKRVAARGSEHQTVRAFIEALSVWHDVEAWGYRRTLQGLHHLEASLPGSVRADAPSQLNRAVLTDLQVPVTLSAEDANRLGFSRPMGVSIVPVRSASAPEWCLVFPEIEDARLEASLFLYADLLVPALDEVSGVETLRLTWAIVEHLLPDSGAQDFEQAAQRAIEEVSRATRTDAWLTISASDSGRRLFTVGSPRNHRSTEDDPRDISIALDAGPRCTTALGLRARTGFDLTQRELNLLRGAGATLGPLFEEAAGRLSMSKERRAVFHSFDRLIERQARNAATRRDDVSVIVIALGEHAPLTDLIQDWIGEIRCRVRPTDLTGRLSSGDIGILLLETPPRRAHFVAHRVQQLIASEQGLASLPDAGVGVAGWSGNQLSESEE